MKKMIMTCRCLLATLICFVLIQSCDIWDEDHESHYVSIGTVKAISEDEDNKEYYFLIDSGKKMYIGNNRFSSTYEWKDGQRGFIHFNTLYESIPGYDYNAEVLYIENILTKDIIDMDEDMVDSIGNDKIDVSFAWFTDEHINIEFMFRGTTQPKKLHMVNLVKNEMNEIQEEDGYLMLEFRHNAYDDNQYETLRGIASFRLAMDEEEIEKYKGIKIKSNSIYEGVQTEIVDFKKKDPKTYGGNGISVQ